MKRFEKIMVGLMLSVVLMLMVGCPNNVGGEAPADEPAAGAKDVFDEIQTYVTTNTPEVPFETSLEPSYVKTLLQTKLNEALAKETFINKLGAYEATVLANPVLTADTWAVNVKITAKDPASDTTTRELTFKIKVEAATWASRTGTYTGIIDAPIVGPCNAILILNADGTTIFAMESLVTHVKVTLTPPQMSSSGEIIVETFIPKGWNSTTDLTVTSQITSLAENEVTVNLTGVKEGNDSTPISLGTGTLTKT